VRDINPPADPTVAGTNPIEVGPQTANGIDDILDPRSRVRAMTLLSTPGRRALPAALNGDRLVRDLLFLATFLLAWFTVSPFPDLGDPRLLEPSTQGDLLNQAATVLLTGALLAYILTMRTSLLPRVVTLPLVLTLIAFAISALLSYYPGLAARRVVLAIFTLCQASALLLLPYGREHFARLLAVAALIVLAVCYFGVTFIPQLSIHQITDLSEPNLAGDWRGFFAHKNGAGASMALLIFIGIFICRAWSRFTGILVVVLAAVFLYFTRDKSSLNLLPVVLALSYLIPRIRSTFLALSLVLGVPLLINLLTLGSVAFEPIKTLIYGIMSDPTYTGRDVIWRFALDHVAERPLFGFGFEAFWGTPDLIGAWNYLVSWGYRASDAHNGYLNLAVTTGLVGLVLALWWIVAQPFADYRRAFALGTDRALTTLFLQIWLFGLCLAGFESVFFRGGSEVWLLMAASIIGIRFQTIARNFA
jgi:O-antigen ligase